MTTFKKNRYIIVTNKSETLISILRDCGVPFAYWKMVNASECPTFGIEFKATRSEERFIERELKAAKDDSFVRMQMV